MKNVGQPHTPDTDAPETPFFFETDRTTVDDGWRLSGSYAITQRGVVITKLCIEPSAMVVDNNGDPRERQPHEIPSRGIDTGVLRLIKLRELRARIGNVVRIQAKLAGLEKELPWMGSAIEHFKAQASKLEDHQPGIRGRKPAGPSKMAAYAEAYLEEATAPEPNYRARLSERWNIGIEGVDSRKKLLQKQDWITGSGEGAVSGPLLDEWRIAHKSEGDD